MAAPDLHAIAAAAKATIDAAGVTLDGNPLRVYASEPRDLDRLPAVTIRFQSFTRRQPDETEWELGSALWDLTYSLDILAPLDDPARGQEGMRAVLSGVLDAIDEDPSLGGAAFDAVLGSGEQSFTDDPNLPRQLVVMTCELRVWARST